MRIDNFLCNYYEQEVAMDELMLELSLAERHLERAQREFHAAQDQVSDLRRRIAQRETEEMRATDIDFIHHRCNELRK